MTSLIVALSTADVTVHAAVVAFLGMLAIAIVAGRIDWSKLQRGNRQPEPIYLRVDRRPSNLYRPPTPRERAAATGGLAGFALIGGIAIALAVSIAIGFLVGSVTDLLR